MHTNFSLIGLTRLEMNPLATVWGTNLDPLGQPIGHLYLHSWIWSCIIIIYVLWWKKHWQTANFEKIKNSNGNALSLTDRLAQFITRNWSQTCLCPFLMKMNQDRKITSSVGAHLFPSWLSSTGTASMLKLSIRFWLRPSPRCWLETLNAFYTKLWFWT